MLYILDFIVENCRNFASTETIIVSKYGKYGRSMCYICRKYVLKKSIQPSLYEEYCSFLVGTSSGMVNTTLFSASYWLAPIPSLSRNVRVCSLCL